MPRILASSANGNSRPAPSVARNPAFNPYLTPYEVPTPSFRDVYSASQRSRADSGLDVLATIGGAVIDSQPTNIRQGYDAAVSGVSVWGELAALGENTGVRAFGAWAGPAGIVAGALHPNTAQDGLLHDRLDATAQAWTNENARRSAAYMQQLEAHNKSLQSDLTSSSWGQRGINPGRNASYGEF